MLELGLKTVIAYLLGALPGSLVLGLLRGVDIRALGSGNAGATNALRTQGKLFAAAVLLFDIGKGVLVVFWLPLAVFPGVPLDGDVARDALTYACALAVIVGHVYPVWFGWRGGKGAATVVGVVAALDARLVIPLLATWLLVLVLSGFVGLATMLAGAALVAAVWFLDPGNLRLFAFAAALAVFIVFTHRSNIARMWRGNENRVRRLWLFRSRAA
jgi:glycerol-3-phosphate acyltransferase PlsY